MPGEFYPVHIQCLPFQPVGGRPNTTDRWNNGVVFFDLDFKKKANVVREGIEIIDNFEPVFGAIVIDTQNVAEGIKAEFRIIAEECTNAGDVLFFHRYGNVADEFIDRQDGFFKLLPELSDYRFFQKWGFLRW